LKTCTFFEAARNNRPCAWTGDDLEAPKMSEERAVAFPRPRGFLEATPKQAFRHVRPITQTDWDFFAQAVENFKVEARKRLGLLENLGGQGAFALRLQRSRCAWRSPWPSWTKASYWSGGSDFFHFFHTPFFVILFPGVQTDGMINFTAQGDKHELLFA
jgi:hypothetical protein